MNLARTKSGMPAKKKDIKCVSIDIGTNYIKCAVGQRMGKKLKVDKTFKIKLNENVYENGRINNIDEMKSALKKALDDNAVKIKQVICTIESSFAIKRDIVIPAVDGEDLSEMVSYEIGQYLPIDINSYVLQYKIVNEIVEENVRKYEILVVALAKDIVSVIYDMLIDMGLEPHALDIHSNAIDKLSLEYEVFNGSSIKDNTVAFLDIGYENINIIIVEKSKYKFNRLIKNGAKELESVSDNEVKSIDDISKNIEIVENWTSEIDKVFKYYTSREVENTIDKIYIYGGISVIQGLDTYIGDRLSIPTQRISSIDDIDIVSGNEDTLSHYLNAISSIIRL